MKKFKSFGNQRRWIFNAALCLSRFIILPTYQDSHVQTLIVNLLHLMA